MSLSKWVYLFLSIFVIGITVPHYQNHLFFLHFVDEDDNIVIGNYVKDGKKLYQNVFSQHQPSMFLLSAAIQKLDPSDNLLTVVKHHRQFMMVWSAIWIIVLVARYGRPLFFVTTLIEFCKIVLLGNLFLAEGIVVYPLLYLISYLFVPRSDKSIKETLIIFLIFWFLWFSLTPLWPLLLIVLGMMFYQTQSKSRFLFYNLLTFFFAILFLHFYVDLRTYFYDALYINYAYYIPQTTRMSLSDSILKAFFAPIYAIFSSKHDGLIYLIKVLSLVYLFNLGSLVKNKKYSTALLTWLILSLCSLRYIDPSNSLYGGFHMLPWFAVLTLFTFQGFVRLKLPHYIFVIIIFYLVFKTTNQNLFDQRDPATDFYVQYSPSVDVYEATRIMAQIGGVKVWVEPVMYWAYWRTGALPYLPMINYYDWMDQTTPMKNQLQNSLQANLPELLYLETQLGIGNYLDQYTRLSRDGRLTNLYLRSDLVTRLPDSTLRELEYYRFKIN